MKKSKIERKTYEERVIISAYGWKDFKEEVERKIDNLSKLGYSIPVMGHDDYEIWLKMTREESDESFNKRLADSERSEKIRIQQKIDKLKKEAEELGLKVV